ncbi:MAG: 3-phosphoserine/phosphohydroxythreonine transaminase [Anaerolineae bacterium]|nr:3-phosphoserine/phosphohydroxythreonine transaminase [Phycisphaerae bacterium]
MSHRIFNFSAGPAMLPTEVLEKSARALVDYEGKGFGIAEVSHRGKEFEAVNDEAMSRCKKLLNLSDSHDVIFLQGGATQLFTLIPMNFLHKSADYLIGGEWSNKSVSFGKAMGNINVVANSEASNFDHSPPSSEWKMSPDADYFHVCSNETVHGHRLPAWPKHPNLIVDASSEFLSRPHPANDCAMVYGGAQKNLGPSGVVLCIIRKDMYAKQKKAPSKLWSFKDQAENKSMINTPPTFGVYVLLEIFRWLDAQGGLAAVEKRNATKAKLLYDAIDNSNGFYKGTVSNKEQRSHMNVTYRLPSEELTDEFVKTATKNQMIGLKGYRTVGGIRASIYNAMPVEGCQSLASFMKDFASKKS